MASESEKTSLSPILKPFQKNINFSALMEMLYKHRQTDTTSTA